MGNYMNTYQVLISDVRVFKMAVQATSLEAAKELADVALDSGYDEHGELVEVRDPQVDDVYERIRSEKSNSKYPRGTHELPDSVS